MKDDTQETRIVKAVKETILKHLENVDSFDRLPAVMSLKEAADETGISIPTLRAKADAGLIQLIRTGTGRGKYRIKKSELLKAMTHE